VCALLSVDTRLFLRIILAEPFEIKSRFPDGAKTLWGYMPK
jgi:hypothetical protein